MRRLVITAVCLNFLCWNLAQASVYSDAVLSQNPAGYWRLNTTSGNDPNEVGGAPSMSVASGVTRGAPGITPADGFFGFEGTNRAFTFANTASSVMSPVTGASAVSSDLGAVSFWVNTTATSFNNGAGHLWYGLQNGDTSGDGFGDDREMHVNYQNGGRIRFFIHGESGSDVNLLTSNSYNDGQWHHVAATWSNSSTSLVIDGGSALGGESLLGGPSNLDGESFSGGNSRFGKPRANRRFYIGDADEVAMFDRQLGANEVAFQYKSALVPEPTTLLIWSLLAALATGMGWRRRKEA